MADTKILIVEDDADINQILERIMKMQGYETVSAFSGSEAELRLFSGAGESGISKEYDLILLDLMLPGIDGYQVCRELRTSSQVPIIMLSAKGEIFDKVLGLELGADDYITKPFLPLELLARVKAQLRRYKRYNSVDSEAAEADEVIVVSGLVLNSRTHECTLNERPLALTPTEFSLLRILCRQRGNVVSSEELLHQLWGEEYYSKSNNTVTVHIRHLREKMGDSFENPKYIKTVWGVGYKIEG